MRPALWLTMLLLMTAAPVHALSIWSNSVTPTHITYDSNDVAPYEFGMKFKSTSDGQVTGVRFYKGPQNTNTHTGTLWTAAGAPLATLTFTNETPTGWQEQSFASPVAIQANTTYVISYYAPAGGYSLDTPPADANNLTAGFTNGPLIAISSSESANGVLNVGAGFPATGTAGNNFWVDVVFEPSIDTNAPFVVSVNPPANASNVNIESLITVSFNEPLLPSSVTTNTFTLVNSSSNPVPASVNYVPGTTNVTLIPAGPLDLGETYTARVVGGGSGMKDASTNELVADYVWSFTTAFQVSLSIWSPTNMPSTVVDGFPYTLGVKFQSTTNGYISGIRFYKGMSNTGVHIGSLWTIGGTKLAEATFASETESGWQEQSFASPVAISSNTTYVASYFTPSGNYAFTADYFVGKGETNGPLIALANGEAGGNCVFAQAASNTFPTLGGGANYWVDVTFIRSLPPDTNAPTVVSVTPGNGASGLELTTIVTATFSEAMDPATVNTNTFELRDGSSNLVPASVTYSGPSLTATLQPTSVLSLGQTYTARIKGGEGGVTDASTNTLASDFNWSFTTTSLAASNIWDESATPFYTSFDDTNSYELGVKFRSAMNGFIKGIRFYKGTNNTGIHIGSLWTIDGTNLATVTFTNETASGWQEQLFASQVPISSNTTYIASYFAPNGGYALTSGYFNNGVTNYPLRALVDGEDGGNGVFSQSSASTFPTLSFGAANYWVDVVFTDQNSPPTAGIVSVSLLEDTATNINLTGSDAESSVSFGIASNPLHGSLSNLDTNNGTVTYLPATNYFGADTFNYWVSDGSLVATGTVNLTIIGVDDPPAADDQFVVIDKDTSTNLVLTATDVDTANSVSEPLAATATASPNNWSVSGTADKVVAVATDDGASTFIRSSTTVPTQQQFQLADPKFIQPGNPISSVTLRATCERSANGGTGFRTAVVLGGNASYGSEHGVGNSYSDYTDTFNSRPGGGAWTLADVQNLQMRIENTQRSADCTKFDALVTFVGATNRSYTILTGPAHGSITGLSTNNGMMTYTPSPGYVGADSFSFRVNAGGVLSTGVVSIAVGGTNNSPIVANPIGNQSATYGTAFSFTFPTNTFTDPDNQALTYSATGLPPGINFTGATRTFDGTPSAFGNYSVSLVAADENVPPLTATNVFDINVAKAALSVTASNLSKPYGVPLSFSGTEFFTTGLKFSDNVSSASLSSAGAPASAAAGPYDITISGATGTGLDNYNLSYINGTLTVTPSAPYSITSIVVTNDVATITWQSISGRVYRLEYKDLITAPAWSEVPVDVISTGTSTSTTNATGGSTNRFYRVK